MNIEDLFDIVDAEIGKPLRRDMTDWEASRLPAVHAKFRKILYFEKIELERMKAGLLPLLRKKRKFYKDGPADKKEEAELGRQDERLVGKVNLGKEVGGKSVKPVIIEMVDFYVESDADVIAAKDLIVQQAEKVDYLKDMLEDVRKRSFSISNIINTQRFKAGLDKLGEIIDLSEPED